LGSVVLGIIIAVITLQNNYTFKKFVERSLISSWESSFNCKVECEVKSINFFFPSIALSRLEMGVQDQSWDCSCAPIQVEFSWFDLIFNGVIEFYVKISDAQVKSLVTNDGLAIVPVINSFLDGGSLGVPAILKSFEIKKGLLVIQDKSKNYDSHISLSSVTKNMYGNFKTKISFLSGDVSIASKKLLDNASGTITIDIASKSGNIYTTIESNVYVDAKFLENNKTCFLTGKWFYDQGVFDLQSQDESFSISPIRVYFLGETLFAELDLHNALSDLAGFLFEGGHDISGKCSTQLRIDYGPLGLNTSGSLLVKDVSYKGIDCFSFGKLSFKKKKDNYNGIVSLVAKEGAEITGNLKFDTSQKKIYGTIANDTDVLLAQLPYWKVPSGKAKLSFLYDMKTSLQGDCSCYLTSEQLDTNIDVASSIVLQEDTFSISGAINNNKYFLDMFISPWISLKQFVYKDSKGKNLFLLGSLKDDRNKLAGTIAFPFIKSLVKDYFDYDIEGEGDTNIYGVLKENHLLCQFAGKHGSISFKNIYNFLNDFKIICKVDLLKKIITIKNAEIKLHKGKINCEKAVVRFDDRFKLDYLYVPLIFNSCFVNVKNDFFALCSGRVLFSQEKGSSPHLAGLTIIERANLRRNIFSQEEIQGVDAGSLHSVSSSGHSGGVAGTQLACSGGRWYEDITCDLSIITKNPVRINVLPLKSGATVDLSLKNKLLSPQISGKIDFLSGTIMFPYKPLYISKGSIYFLPHQSEDPLVEFVAKNKVNKYNIMMYITGSFDNHQISFESCPPQSEEQILALLIAGSAQESLNVVAPALIMQQLRDSLFGSGGPESESRFGAKDYFSKILKPFRKVRIVPSFTDQTGRGGLRGAVEIDINDRFRAFIEKNFSLSEDTRFEIEYLLSDDVSMRAFRRENGDIGGEAEMRWKF